MKARAINKAYTLDGAPTVTFEVTKDFLNNEMLDGRDVDLSVKALRKKRSLSANAYMWALINELAAALRTSSDEIYHYELGRYGTYERADGAVKMITVRADISLDGWLFIHTKAIKTVEIGGEMFTHYAVIKGTSEYDTKEMSIMLDGVIDDCKTMGIETMTPDELARLQGYEVNHSGR